MPRDPGSADLSAIVPVILAGGRGRRLWPLSTAARPKPFLKLPGGKSFLQKTVERVAGLKAPLIVCAARHRALVMEQAQAGEIICEPEPRGTAPAIAAAAHLLAARGDPLMLVMPSDHAIREPDILLDAASRGLRAAQAGILVTFGVTPHAPSVHYGYIKAGEALENGLHRIESFVEKPGRETARAYLRSGSYFWNSGIFLFSAKTYLARLKRQQAEMHDQAYKSVRSALRRNNSVFLDRESFSACPALSIDYAVMEREAECAVIPVSMGWRDLGTWLSLLAAAMER